MSEAARGDLRLLDDILRDARIAGGMARMRIACLVFEIAVHR
jgi:hypothetical protein